MSFVWTPHRFAGGALALDVANSVIQRFDAARSTDRFEVREQLQGFSAAAARFSAERTLFGDLAPVGSQEQAALIALREATDRYFRAQVMGAETDALLAALMAAVARALTEASDRTSLLSATAHSVIRLAALPERQRLKICPNCGWLFLDRSKNISRAWCDMAVCGNRVKASRHRRKKEDVP